MVNEAKEIEYKRAVVGGKLLLGLRVDDFLILLSLDPLRSFE